MEFLFIAPITWKVATPLNCFACRREVGANICAFHVEDALVKVLLCKECQKLDKTTVLMRLTYG